MRGVVGRGRRRVAVVVVVAVVAVVVVVVVVVVAFVVLFVIVVARGAICLAPRRMLLCRSRCRYALRVLDVPFEGCCQQASRGSYVSIVPPLSVALWSHLAEYSWM